jgi:branched-chain amino acid transport system substrate-binding protein
MLHSVTGTKKLARFAYAKGFRKVAIFSTQQTWCIDQANNFEDEFLKAGGTIVAKVETLPSAADIRPEVMKIKESQPDLVFSTDMAAVSPSPRELRKAGYTGQIMTPLIDETMLQKNADALEGAFYYSDYSGTDEFERKFSARFKHKPSTGADTGYNAIHAIVGAINEAKSFDAKVVQPVLLKRKFKGATGEVQFDDQGGIVQDPKVFQIKGKNRVEVAE